MRIGIDLGGTKIEAIALDDQGGEHSRIRVDTPRGDYPGTVAAIKGLVERVEAKMGMKGTVGVGIPGTVVRATGLVKNANSTWLNGEPLERDLSAALGREVRCANDANCFAVSEATDGAAAGHAIVFGVILGTGCGGGIAIHGNVHSGRNGNAGEWGHTPLPWATGNEIPGRPCYCGLSGCLETWISGTAFEKDFTEVTGRTLRGKEIVAGAEKGDAECAAALDRLENRLGRALAVIVNILDPDVIVLGGGLSNLDHLYSGRVESVMRQYVFGKQCDTPIVRNTHGDSSGVRGAAWLWPATAPGGAS
ncbi:fructokinase [Bryocella elongata]|uniref:Fructokinase n=1 Tax=Bryocella elongata TaxID=863522 RepID=A0A1H5UIV2_9BACT|nr:ROK family protein [Bryocella elongata]SEF74952.1 fructokinase [Bryocella elongata]